ncbi:MAG: S-layer homology domain-containing protein [Oscillospiraceae bacterium]|nr:S-layer homology domain-containing protein [Oscillospiraceae bacterium]
MSKRIASAFLALIMLFSILSMPALAAKNGWLDDEQIEEDIYEDEDSEGGGQQLVRDDEEEAEEKPKKKKKNDPQIVFTDVPADAWYYDVVMDLAEAKIIGGFGDGTFRPSATVTTGQALKMILLAAGYEEPERVDSHWARCFLNLALDEKILERGEITDLDINMSRKLVAKVAAVSLDIERTDDEQVFTDTDDDHVHALHEIGILGGYDDGTFRPDKALTRAELSAIAHRIYAYLEDLRKEKDDEEDYELDEDEVPELRTSEDAIEYLKTVEGFCKEPYWDYQQYSIGYGSHCDPDDYPDGITKKEAEILLRQIVHTFEEDLDAFLKKHKIKLDDNEYDALILFTYNVGSTWMRSSRLSDLLIDGDYDENDFASAFGVWCHVGSSEPEISSALVKRRIRELQIFFDADYTGKKSDGFVVLYYVTDIGEVETDIGFYREDSEYDPLYDAYSDDGEEFLGWETEDGYMITEDDVAEEDLTVYAVWDY